MQVPFEQAGEAFVTLVVHGLGDPHDPLAAQLSTLAPEHVICPGAQTPSQLAGGVTQVWLTHANAALHVPFVWQVSTPLPEHVV